MRFASSARLRIEKDVIIRIYRTLKGKGKISVSEGVEVIPSDIIGTANIASGFSTISLAEVLSVAPNQVEKYLKRSLGQRIFKGELLAYKSGWIFGGKKIVLSPTDGVLDFINPKTGELRMTFLPKKMDLPAGVYGIVESVNSEKGLVIIRTQASIIHGIFGSGRIRDGILQSISRKDELISKSMISPSLGGEVLIGGGLIFKDAISAAISAGVSGIISGGINAKDYRSMASNRLIFPKKLENDIGVSLVICEGFGSIPLGDDIYELLKSYDGRFISLDGNKSIINLPSFQSSSIDRVKKTKLPPLQNDNLSDEFTHFVDLEKGCRVRVIGNSYLGEQGEIVALDQTESVLPSSIRTYLATIMTRSRKIKVPVANLEVIL